MAIKIKIINDCDENNMTEKDLIRNLNKILYRPDFTNALKVDTCKTLLSSYEGAKDGEWIS